MTAQKIFRLLYLTGRLWLGLELMPGKPKPSPPRQVIYLPESLKPDEPGTPQHWSRNDILDQDTLADMLDQDTLAEILGDEPMPEGQVMASDFFVDVSSAKCPKCAHVGVSAMTMIEWRCPACLHGWQLEPC